MSVGHPFTPMELVREPQFALAGIRVHPATLEVLGDAGREVLEPREVLAALARRRRASAAA